MRDAAPRFSLTIWQIAKAIELHCLDLWESQGLETSPVLSRFNRNTKLAIANAKNPVELKEYRGLSSNSLTALCHTLGEEYFDFIYVDGGHDSPTVLCDAILSFKLARVGAVIVFDDYLWITPDQLSVDLINNPKLAIDAFTSIFFRKLRILSGFPLYQIYLQKISN